MDEQAKADAVAAIAARHVEVKRKTFRDQVALRVLEEQGTVSLDEIDARFQAEWVEPDARTLADVVAAKTAAAVEFHRREVAWEAEAVERAREKVDRVRETAAGLVASAVADLEAAEASSAPGDARQRLADAVELAEYAAARGDASAAPPPLYVTATAKTANGKGGK